MYTAVRDSPLLALCLFIFVKKPPIFYSRWASGKGTACRRGRGWLWDLQCSKMQQNCARVPKKHFLKPKNARLHQRPLSKPIPTVSGPRHIPQVWNTVNYNENSFLLFLNGKGFKFHWHCTDKWGTLSATGAVNVSSGTETLMWNEALERNICHVHVNRCIP